MKRLVSSAALAFCGLITAAWADSVVVFNEIMYHPPTNEPAMEWVELRNQMAVDVDISNWSLDGAIQYTFPSNSIVRGGGFVVVAIDPLALSTATGLTGIQGPFTGRLGNNGDHLILRNNSGRPMDEVTYGAEGNWPVAPDGSGVSLAKLDRETASGPSANWGASEQVGGTPGAENFTRALGFIPPPGLVSYWSFNESAGTALDQASQNHGTPGSGATRSTGAGVGGGITFNGTTNAYVNAGPGTGNNFSVSSGITIEAVLQPGWSGTNSAIIFGKIPPRPGAYRATVVASQPIAYWRLDDATTTIADSTANARNGTATAGVMLNQPSLIPTDPADPAVRATGSDRITVNGFEKIGARGYTVEFWVKPHVLPAACCQNLVGDGEASGDYFMMNYILGPNQGLVGAIRPHFGPANSPVSLSGGTALRTENVYHVVTTWDATSSANNAVIYLNGVADTVGTTTQNVPTAGTTGANKVYIGHDEREVGDGSYTYDEVALYNYPLSADAVAAHYLAATATNFDLNLGNAVQLAFQNDGKNAQANPPVAAGPVLSFGLVVGGVYGELDMPLDGQAGRPTLAALEDGRLHYVAATYNSSTGLKGLYVDGVLCFSTTLSGTINANNGANAVLGNGQVNGQTPFVGLLDEMAYWNRALNASEVAAHSAAVQAGRNYFAPPSEGELPRLAFNEISSSTNGAFWLELVNFGTNTVSLDGLAIILDGTNNFQYLFPSNHLTLAPGSSLALTNNTLGFYPESGNKLFLTSAGGTQVLDSVVVKKRARARCPDGTGDWLYPSAPTPGAPNSFSFRNEIVINEIMYNHALLPGTNNVPTKESPEGWVEFYNRSGAAVDLSGWQVEGGIHYQFPPGATIGAGAYLVVAKDAASLRLAYPSIDILGNFSGNLSGRSDKITLKDPTGNPANEVVYHDDGHWPVYANGGGSSLELRDPNADNSKAEAWAPSDESSKSSWQSYRYRMVANIPSGSGQPTQWNDFIFGLLGVGECLIDDLSVLQTPATAPVQIIANGNFESGLTGWRAIGDHGRSFVETESGNLGNHVLHVVATGPQEHMHNHVETTLTGGRTIVNGTEYEISFRAKWLAGNSLLNTRLYFNRVARTTALPTPSLNGTPGARNSRCETNIGPTFAAVQHNPVIPQAGQPVTVSLEAQDPQGVSSCRVWWSANGGAWSSAVMTNQGGSRYAGALPGQVAGTIVQFYAQATDSLGATATWPAAGTNSGVLYTVADGQANLTQGHNIRIILTPANRDLLHALTNVMSNENLPATVIYDEKRAYYDVGVRLKGSERGRYSDTRTSFHIEFQPDDLFRGVHPVMLIDRSGAGDATANKQMEIVIKHMLTHAGNIPGIYSDICRVIAPKSTHTGPAIFSPRHEDEFIETAFANGGGGTEWELELIYYPTTANSFGYKLPQPDNVVATDISNLGDDEEIYRYNFIIKNHRDGDNYAPFMNFAKTLSLTGTALDQASRQVMDVDEWMRAWALVTLCGVNDSYTFGNNHNLLMYLRPSDGRMLAFPVDMDFSFNRAYNAALIGDQNLSKVINLTPNLRVFYAHILDIIGSTFNVSYMARWPGHYDDFCPGQDFTSALTYIQQRGDYAKSVISSAGGNSAFAVTSPTSVTTASNMVTITGTAPVTARTIKVNGAAYAVTWTNLSGWTIRVPVNSPTNVLAVACYDLYDQPITNLSQTVTVNYTGAAPDPIGAVVINEVMYHPFYHDAAYLELFNTSATAAFDLSGWRINGLSYTFPPGSLIGRRQCMILASSPPAYVAAYGTGVLMPFDTFSGNLQNNGETLTLLKPGSLPGDEEVVDRVRYDSVMPWPAAADGTGSSLQLIDANQDNSRPGNWFSKFVPARYTDPVDFPGATNSGWRQVVVTSNLLGGTYQNVLLGYITNVVDGVTNRVTNSVIAHRLMVYLDGPGDVYLDNLSLVVGTNAEQGLNYVHNGDFESPLADSPVLTNSWIVGTNYTNTAISTSVNYSGNSSLHLVSSGSGVVTNRLLMQHIYPPLPSNSVSTLSFWYLVNTNQTSPIGTNLTVRIQNGPNLTTNVLPVVTPAYYTPPQVITAATNYLSPGLPNPVATNLPAIPPLWLNEVQVRNLTGLQDGAGHRGPWIELFNSGTNVEALEGLYLANDYSNLTQWAFPAGVTINPGEFKVIFADGASGESTASELHTRFMLSSSNGAVALARLYNGQPQVLDYANYPDMPADYSYGSYPDGQLFFRQQFYYPTPGASNNPASPPLPVVINEWMASNTGYTNNPADGATDDWFELYNFGTNAVDLGGYYLTDNQHDRFQFQVPINGQYVVPPRGYLLVWADGKTNFNGTGADLHVNFQLSKSGESLALNSPEGLQIDAVAFGAQSNNVSQGRYPDGGAAVYDMVEPTPKGPNRLSLQNTAPVLEPVGTIDVTLGQTLRFQAIASDAEVPPQTLTWSLANAPAGAAIDPQTGDFQWTPAANQAPGTNEVTVRVADDGTPPMSAEQLVVIRVWLQSRMSLVSVTDGQMRISFETVPGKTYRLEGRTNLTAGAWSVLQDNIPGNGLIITVTNDASGLPQQFYRTVQKD